MNNLFLWSGFINRPPQSLVNQQFLQTSDLSLFGKAQPPFQIMISGFFWSIDPQISSILLVSVLDLRQYLMTFTEIPSVDICFGKNCLIFDFKLDGFASSDGGGRHK